MFSSSAIIVLGQKVHQAEALAKVRLHELDDSMQVLRASQGRLQLATEVSGIGVMERQVTQRPDVVMHDIGMPRMNGYEACRRIRKHADNRDTVIIAVTGWSQDEDRRRSEQAGFNLHLTKPVDPAAVEAILAFLPPARAWVPVPLRAGSENAVRVKPFLRKVRAGVGCYN